jgi:transmembrane sensor
MNTQTYEEATNWLIKHREAGLDPHEKRAFDTWLRESPEHVRAYLEMSGLWEDVAALDVSWNPAAEELIARARGEGNVYTLLQEARIACVDAHSRPAVRGPIAAASLEDRQHDRAVPAIFHSTGQRYGVKVFTLLSALLMAIGAATVWYWLNRNTYATEVGEQRSIALVDGSTIELNSHSRVRIRYSDSQRDVDLLEGQALFQVAHDIARPFVVHSGTASVCAIGTQFDVYRKHADIVVTVVEGEVAVLMSAAAPVRGPVGEQALVPTPREDTRTAREASSGVASGTAIYLAAGEQLIVPAAKPAGLAKSSAADVSRHANVAAATAWTHRELLFESTPLTEVTEEFNRYNSRHLVITDPGLAHILISGVFSSADPVVLLRFLHTQPEISIVETDSEIRIGKR